MRNSAALSLQIKLSLLSLDDENALNRAPAVKVEMHARTRSDQMRIDCSAIFIEVANFPAEHIRYRLSVGRGLHNDRRGGVVVIWPGVNAVTVPTVTAPVVICVVAGVIKGCVVVVCRVLVVFVCATAKGATIAQARTIVVRLMCSLSLS